MLLIPLIPSISATAQSQLAGDMSEMIQQHLSMMPFAWHYADEKWANFIAWLSQPHVYAVIIAWAVTFTVVSTLILSLGFGPAGIVAGTMAAAFQSWMYGGFTPAGGIFATLTSMAMVGSLLPPVCIFASVVATFVAAMVWIYGAGR